MMTEPQNMMVAWVMVTWVVRTGESSGDVRRFEEDSG
jgi:hypothetical protein